MTTSASRSRVNRACARIDTATPPITAPEPLVALNQRSISRIAAPGTSAGPASATSRLAQFVPPIPDFPIVVGRSFAPSKGLRPLHELNQLLKPLCRRLGPPL